MAAVAWALACSSRPPAAWPAPLDAEEAGADAALADPGSDPAEVLAETWLDGLSDDLGPDEDAGPGAPDQGASDAGEDADPEATCGNGTCEAHETAATCSADCTPQPHYCDSHCGKPAPSGCYCDDECGKYGDCCKPDGSKAAGVLKLCFGSTCKLCNGCVPKCDGQSCDNGCGGNCATSACDDGLACSTGDTCKGAVCQGTGTTPNRRAIWEPGRRISDADQGARS
jgi:hypothetical protein